MAGLFTRRTVENKRLLETNKDFAKNGQNNRYSKRCYLGTGLICLCVALIAAGVLVGLLIYNRDNGNFSVVGQYTHAAVASDSPPCSKIGTYIMKDKNGSAVDGALAAIICNGVYNFMSSGIGGGSFALIYNRTTRQFRAFDYREVAPKAATADMFNKHPDIDASEIGPLAIGVPGELAGYETLHSEFGRVPWSDLFQPTIHMCEEGFKVGKALAQDIQKHTEEKRLQYGLKDIITNPETGERYKEGETIRLPRLGATLRRLAADGGRAFYEGSLAEDILADLSDAGSIITSADLKEYKVRPRSTIHTTIKDLDAYNLTPPSGGAVVQFILNILKGYNISPKDVATTQSQTLTYHRIIEAMKFAFAHRSRLGDQDFVDVMGIVSNMTNPEYGDHIREKITDDITHSVEYYGADFFTEDHGTTHLSVIDKDGNAVAITSTINLWFGSTVVGRRTGILFNDGMDDFSISIKHNFFGLPPSKSNFIEPGKRAMSSMSPTIVVNKDGDVVEVTGASGGSKIITATALNIIRSLLLGRSTSDSIDIPRFHHQLVPINLFVEPNFSQSLIDGLRKRGHNISNYAPSASCVQSIERRGAYWEAVSDKRKFGKPFGY